MRLLHVSAAAALVLGACGQVRSSGVHELAPRSERYIRLYDHSVPECPFREVGNVSGRSYREIQAAAFRLHANAVILEPAPATQSARSGTAVQYTRADCQR
ncbi:MAG TPA: hypothetical protein VF006_02220 [Longimicrobium sp.]